MSDKYIDLKALVVGEWYTCRQNLVGTSNNSRHFYDKPKRFHLEKETPFMLLNSEITMEGDVWLTVLSVNFGRFYFYFTDREFANAFRSIT